MSTYIEFQNGDTAHIYDKCIGSSTLYIHIETGHVYEREKTAIKRAITLHKKQLYESGDIIHKRRRIIHSRKNYVYPITIPTIVSKREGDKMTYCVVETGKKYKTIKKAIKKAIEYVLQSSK